MIQQYESFQGHGSPGQCPLAQSYGTAQQCHGAFAPWDFERHVDRGGHLEMREGFQGVDWVSAGFLLVLGWFSAGFRVVLCWFCGGFMVVKRW